MHRDATVAAWTPSSRLEGLVLLGVMLFVWPVQDWLERWGLR
jgi:hypothetical protein